MDFNDTFLSFEHVKECFPDYRIEAMAEAEKMVPPFQYVDFILFVKAVVEGGSITDSSSWTLCVEVRRKAKR